MKKVEAWEVLLGLCALLVLLFYICTHVDFEDILRPQPTEPSHMNGKVNLSLKLKDVQMITIPSAVYDDMKEDPAASKYLKGNEKYVLMLFTPGCPYATAFKNSFQTLFRQKGYKEYYRKHIFNLGMFTTISCRNSSCPKAWIFNHCGNGFCIIHPQRRKAVIDNSQDAQQIARTLEKYKDW